MYEDIESMFDGLESKELTKIIHWDYQDFDGLMNYVAELWHWNDWGYIRDNNTVTLHTGGWSDNELIIEAMNKNWLFWNLYWISSKRGGHYVFNKNGESE